MKNWKYIIILSFGLNGCVEDAQLADNQMIGLDISVQVEENSIVLNADIAPNSNPSKITERGFIFTHKDIVKWGKVEIYKDTIRVPDGSDFQARITEIFDEKIECQVFAYVETERKLFRSKTTDFIAGGNTEMQISSVKITSADKNTSGKIVIEGNHFSSYESAVSLNVDTLLPGDNYFSLRECSPQRLVFEYICCNIGTFPLRLKVREQEIQLTERLQVKGPSLKGFIPARPRINEYVEVLLDNPTDAQEYGMKTEEGKPSAKFKMDNGKIYVKFQQVSPEAAIQIWYTDGENIVYMQPQSINFSIPWIKEGNISFMPEVRAIAGDKIYSFKNAKLYSYSLKDKATEIHQAVYPHGYSEYGYNNHVGSVCILGDDVYICQCLSISPPATSETHIAMILMKFNLKTHQWVVLGELPTSGIGKLNAIICNRTIFMKEQYSYGIVTYELDKGTFDIHSEMFSRDVIWAGTYKDHFYYIENNDFEPALRRMKVGEWKPSDNLYQPEDSWRYSFYHAWIMGDYLYMNNPMLRMDLSADGLKVESLGNIPSSSTPSIILPTINGIYCMDFESNLFRFVEDR